LPPFAGATPAAKHASYTGARHAVKTWTAKQSAYLQLLRNAGALTDQEAAGILQWPLATVNSVRNGIGKWCERNQKPAPFTTDGFEEHTWDNGGHDQTGLRWTLVSGAEGWLR
jgi:hypothetical protein